MVVNSVVVAFSVVLVLLILAMVVEVASVDFIDDFSSVAPN